MGGQNAHHGNAAEAAAQAAAGLLEATVSGDFNRADTELLEALAGVAVPNVQRYIERVRRLYRNFDRRENIRRQRWVSPRSKPTETERYLIERTRSGAFILVCSENGFERERALEAVRQIPNGFGLALIIVRLNDWVDEVRRAARSALVRHAATLGTDVLLECFELYLASSDWGRMNVADRVVCDDLFRRRVPSETLIAAIISSREDRWLRSINRMLRRADWDMELPRIANTARHWAIRFKAIQALLRGEHQWADRGSHRRPLLVAIDREALIHRGLEDSSPTIRLAALRAYAETLDISKEVSRPRFEQLVLDKSAKVASSAAFWLSRVGGDPAGVLRRHAMSTGPLVPVALSLLGTIGKPADHRALLQVAATHPSRTRWAALSSAAQLARDEVLPHIKEIAIGEDIVEARRAVRALVVLGEGLAFEKLMLWAKKPEQFVDRRYLDLAHQQVPWRGLAIMLTLALHGVPVESLQPHLELVFERSKRNWLPNASERVQLMAMLERLPVSQSQLLQSLRWVIEHSS
jgi:HEAT repeat protein